MKRTQIITPIIVGIAAIASLIATANDALALSRAEIKQLTRQTVLAVPSHRHSQKLLDAQRYG